NRLATSPRSWIAEAESSRSNTLLKAPHGTEPFADKTYRSRSLSSDIAGDFLIALPQLSQLDVDWRAQLFPSRPQKILPNFKLLPITRHAANRCRRHRAGSTKDDFAAPS